MKATRREFLHDAALAGMTAMFASRAGSLAAAQAAGSPWSSRIGLELYTVRDLMATDYADATQPKQADKSLGDLFGELSAEFVDLMQTQLELAKTEMRDEARRAGRTAGIFGAAGVAGYMALVLLSFAVAWGLATLMNPGWAFLIVGALYAIAGAVLYMQGRERAKDINFVPEQTAKSVKEDVQWARHKIS